MPEPGMGSRGSRSGAGMGGGGGYAGPEIDWGMGPEGHEATEVSRSVGEDRDFDDVSPLDEKMSFMSSNPLGNPSNLFATKTPTQPVSNLSFYLDETPATVAKTDIENKKQSAVTMPSDWMAQRLFEDETGQTVHSGHSNEMFKEMGPTKKSVPSGGTTYTSPDQLTMSILRAAKKNLDPLDLQWSAGKGWDMMVAALKMGLDPNQIATIIGTTDPTIEGSYHGPTDVTKINTTLDNYLEPAVHELVGHRLMNQLQHKDFKDFLNTQLSDVQALYEDDSAQMGEMITSRAGTLRDLLNLNAPIHAGSGPYAYGMDWENFSDHMKKQKEADWNLYDPNKNLTDMEQVGYYETHTAPYFDENWALHSEPTKSVKIGPQSNPGVYFAGKKAMAQPWKQLAKNYENYVRFNQELPPERWGGESAVLKTIFTPEGDIDEETTAAYNLNKVMNPFGPVGDETSMSIQSRTPGLMGWPMTHNHFLVDRVVGRHLKHMPNEIQRTIKNEFNATLANPSSMINKINKLGLADKFWEYVEEFISEESENWSPSEAKAEIQRLLAGDS